MPSKTEPMFKVGDVVRLKSGGLSMTVFRYDSSRNHKDEPVFCKWFEAAPFSNVDYSSELLTSGHFPEGVLVKVAE
jgi:uncharacterized protein YodC (DUF2158 family)